MLQGNAFLYLFTGTELVFIIIYHRNFIRAVWHPLYNYVDRGNHRLMRV